jgi:hypothetical protein
VCGVVEERGCGVGAALGGVDLGGIVDNVRPRHAVVFSSMCACLGQLGQADALAEGAGGLDRSAVPLAACRADKRARGRRRRAASPEKLGARIVQTGLDAAAHACEPPPAGAGMELGGRRGERENWRAGQSTRFFGAMELVAIADGNNPIVRLGRARADGRGAEAYKGKPSLLRQKSVWGSNQLNRRALQKVVVLFGARHACPLPRFGAAKL